MKIGVDARLLSRPITGIGRYTLEMCRALSRRENVKLYLYSPAPVREGALADANVEKIRTGRWTNGVARQIWAETSLPLLAKKDAVDVFWGATHRLPRCLPKSIARVVTIHDFVWKYAAETMRPFSRLLESYQVPIAMHNADRIVVDSHATLFAVQKEFSAYSKKVAVVPLGSTHCDSHIKPLSLQHLGLQMDYFLFVGTLEPRKNLFRLLTAYSRLPTSLKNKAMLVIAGGKGWGGVNVAHAVASLGLDDYVCLLGYVEEHTLAALYANAKFLAMPSLYEGFGLPVVEAMSYGVPVLTSNNSSMPEVAGDAGLLVDPLDVESIRAGLARLIFDSEYRGKLAAFAKDNARHFDWDLSAEKITRVFEEAIVARRGLAS